MYRPPHVSSVSHAFPSMCLGPRGIKQVCPGKRLGNPQNHHQFRFRIQVRAWFRTSPCTRPLDRRCTYVAKDRTQNISGHQLALATMTSVFSLPLARASYGYHVQPREWRPRKPAANTLGSASRQTFLLAHHKTGKRTIPGPADGEYVSTHRFAKTNL